MYCTKCGGKNSETAVYCRKCGALMDPEEETRVSRQAEATRNDPLARPPVELGDEIETRVAARPAGTVDLSPPGPLHRDDRSDDDNEQEIFSISPTLLFVKIGYVLAAAGALLLVAILSMLLPFIRIWIDVVLGLMLLLVPAFYHVKQKLVRYTLTDTKLEIDQGLISRQTRNIPLRRIQDVTVSSSVLQRLLGFGDIVIDNASEEGGKIVFKDIDAPRKYADDVLRQMRRLEK